ncbi:caspase, EACC1-associated type [Streptomyces sp. 4F14]|uniref:caspase, EACC1-associated type n=1 Tax=Streptomyces sp. 4F14 TaxID=3394380 RepID=UPI003A848B6A
MTGAGLSDPAASRAVLIGTHEYRHLPRLPAVERSLSTLAEVLRHPDVWGLRPQNCRVVSQPENADTVLDALTDAAGSATDTLLVYYAGHGLIDQHNDELVLALPGSRQQRPDTALPYTYLRRVIGGPRCTARRKVVVLDCCFSGRALAGEMAGAAPAGEQIADHARIEGTFLLTATAETRKAVSLPGEPYTAFTGELIATLVTGVPGGPPHLDMTTLYQHLHARLAARGRPLPQQRNRNFGASIALARNRAVTPVPPDDALSALAAPRAPEDGRAARRTVLLAVGGLLLGGAGTSSWLALRGDRDAATGTAGSPHGTPENTPHASGTSSASPSTSPTAASPTPSTARVHHKPTLKWTSTFDDGVVTTPVAVGSTLWIAGGRGRMFPTAAATGKQTGYFETGSDTVLPQPAVSGDVVYVGAQLGPQLFAVNGSTTRRKWTYEADGYVNSEPAVSDGTVFVTCFNGTLHAVNAANGTRRWSRRFSTTSTFPCTAADGRAFVTQADASAGGGPLLAVRARDGEPLWRSTDPVPTHAYPAVHGDTLLVSTWDVGLTAFDAASGRPKWTYSMKSPGATGPVTLGGETAYFGGPSGLHAVDVKTGRGRWTAPLADVGRVAVADGLVYVAGSDRLHALEEKTGSEVWTFELRGAGTVLVTGGVAYVTSDQNRLYAVTV